MKKVIVRSAVLWALLAGVVAEVALLGPRDESPDATTASLGTGPRAQLCRIDDRSWLPLSFAGASGRTHLDALVRSRPDALARAASVVATSEANADAIEQALHLGEPPAFAGWHESRAAEDEIPQQGRVAAGHSPRAFFAHLPTGPLGSSSGAQTGEAAQGGSAASTPVAGLPADEPLLADNTPVFISDPGLNGLIADLSGQPVDLRSDDYTRTAAVTPPVAVPEPATWTLLVAGLAGLGAARRQRARQGSSR